MGASPAPAESSAAGSTAAGTAATGQTVPVPRTPAGPQPPLDAAERGRTAIPDRVVARIADQAASEVDGVRPAAPHGPSGPLGPLSAVRPGHRTSARTTGGGVHLTLVLAVDYPRPVGRAAAEVRRRVAERVQQTTGLAAPRIDIEVTALVPEARAR
ncbi:Asp23/Gls24 family envelope stress response protein [Nocardiopsis coralliicola]